MAGMVMDAVLMLLLVAALGYGLRLEKKLRALREGQLAFAGAVTELNAAAGRAEAALASLRASGQETDLLHDRIVKAREVKAQLEGLIARGAAEAPARAAGPAPAPAPAPVAAPIAAAAPAASGGGLLNAEQVERFTPVLQALAASRAAKQSLNRARRTLDEDLFAA